MKKIYLLLALGFTLTSNAQLVLTKAANEPVSGDVENRTGLDSVGTVPQNTGANQIWNFSAFAQSTVTVSKTFATASSVSTGTNFPSATYVEQEAGGDDVFFKSTSTPTTQLELVGIANSNGAVFNFTNSLISAIWPVSFGSTISDVGTGTASIASMSGVIDATVNASGAGSGTLNLPGSQNLTNVLQIVSNSTLTALIGTAPSTISMLSKSKTYSYYHNSVKFPIITVDYKNETLSSVMGPTNTVSAEIFINNLVLTGLNDKNFEATFQIFPNPATNYFDLNLSNPSNENGTVLITNAIGQVVRTIELGNDSQLKKQISISDLQSGVYLVRTTLGSKISTRKLIIE
ncbi:MAG: T9SS type A sorting domain-containing protein [Bacteroidia bacterium]|nr:T9SS type A sorting domain-containing protein [Bacteroidia bacterium]